MGFRSARRGGIAGLMVVVACLGAWAGGQSKKPDDPLLGTAIVHEGPLWSGGRWVVRVDGVEYGAGDVGLDKTLAFADRETSPGVKELHVLRCPDLGRAKGVRLMDGKAALLEMKAFHKRCFKLTRGATRPDGTTEFTVTSKLDDEEQDGEPRLPGERIPSILDKPESAPAEAR